MSMQKTAKRIIGALLAGAVALGCATAVSAADDMAPDLSGTTDASIRDVITRVAHHQIHELKDGDYTPVDSIEAAKAAKAPEGLMWVYPWGVTLYGMLRVNDVTGDKDVEHFVLEHNLIVSRYYAWLEGLRAKLGNDANFKAFAGKTKIGPLIKLGNLDSCGAMGAQFMEGLLHHTEKVTPGQEQVVKAIADYITKKQARLPDGTLWRPTAMGGTIWLDDLYMGCPFMLRWSQYTHDPKLIDDCAAQVINMARRLQDTNGVFYHGYFEKKQERSPIKWGRADGWTMVATVEVLSAMPEDHPDRTKLLDILRRQIEGIKPLQTESGMWRQVLDHPESWEETSCTAMFAYSIARAANRGWIDPSNMAVARKAFAGVCRHVTPDGAVNGTCQGTNIGMDMKYYIDRPRPDDDLHGRGPTMLAGAEILQASKK
jgi:unsaturated rhamnogalacturonyl hydrolase